MCLLLAVQSCTASGAAGISLAQLLLFLLLYLWRRHEYMFLEWLGTDISMASCHIQGLGVCRMP